MTYERTTGTQCVARKCRPWTKEEDAKLSQIVQAIEEQKETIKYVYWAEIAKGVLGRTDKQCYDRWNRYINTKIKKGRWSSEEDGLLRRVVEELGTSNWAEIAKRIPGRTGRHCRVCWSMYLHPNINKDPWTPEECKLLIEKQREFGNKWNIIATYLPRRSYNDMKNHWYRLQKKRKSKSSRTTYYSSTATTMKNTTNSIVGPIITEIIK